MRNSDDLCWGEGEQPTALSLNGALAKITRNPALMAGDLQPALDIVALEGCRALLTSRVSIWVVDYEEKVLHNLACSDGITNLQGVRDDFPLATHAEYFGGLKTERLLVISNMDVSSPMTDVLDDYNENVCSLLDSPVRVGGELVGVVCIEQFDVGRDWSVEEQNFASSLADMTALAMEATERKKTLDALNETNRRTETLMSNLPGMVYQCLNDPPNFTFTFVSEGSYQLTGYTPQDLMYNNALKFFDMIHPDDVEPLEMKNQETLVIGLPLDTTFRIIMRDGTVKWIWERSRVVQTNPDGTPHLLEGFYTDITEQRRLEAADLANRAKSEFLANMSHEIRTPMNAVLGMAELAMRENPSPQVLSYLANIKSASNSLLSIINDILDFSKIEAGAMELNASKYHTASFVNDIATMIYVRIGEKPISFIVDEDPNLPAMLIGDVTKIKQIAINLLTNAVKFTPEGHIRLGISGMARDDGKYVLSMVVEDTGIGIKKEDLPMLFENFSQLDTKKNRAVEGTGLGLAISKKLVELMNGSLWVQSTYGKGSTFSFTIEQEAATDAPMAKSENPERYDIAVCVQYEAKQQKLVEKAHKLGVKAEAVLPEDDVSGFTHVIVDSSLLPRLKGLGSNVFPIVLMDSYMQKVERIERGRNINAPLTCVLLADVLDNHDHAFDVAGSADLDEQNFFVKDTCVMVVDDNDINLIIAETILSDYHAEVMLAKSGQEALDLIGLRQCDMIFMDHMMPEMDGVEATQLIRQLPEAWCHQVPIIALTANAISGVRDLFIASGMNDFLSKPLELDELRRVLKTWLAPEKIDGGS